MWFLLDLFLGDIISYEATWRLNFLSLSSPAPIVFPYILRLHPPRMDIVVREWRGDPRLHGCDYANTLPITRASITGPSRHGSLSSLEAIMCKQVPCSHIC